MKIVAGLGNPGDRYAETRHNIGFMVAARLASEHGISLKKSGHHGIYGVGRLSGQEAAILLPQTFMNLSGVSVASAIRSFALKPEDLIAVHDDIDLPFGQIRIKSGGGHGGHNGIRSISQTLGSGDFIRLKIGVGRPDHGEVADYVLRPFSSEEKKGLGAVLENAIEALEVLFARGVQAAMNEFNSRNISQIKS